MALKRYRIYFNRPEDFPQIWSFDEGSHASEVNVQAIVIDAPATTHANLQAVEFEPKAWTEVHAELDLVGGVAYFRQGAKR